MDPDMEPIHIPFNCYVQDYKEKMSNITWSYWNNLNQSVSGWKKYVL